jgi:hypothetical protein
MKMIFNDLFRIFTGLNQAGEGRKGEICISCIYLSCAAMARTAMMAEQ